MFTFRTEGDSYQSIHSHRLLYLHSSARDHQVTDKTRRIKTQADQFGTYPMDFSRHSSTKRTDTSGRGSTKKIQYFNLDLKQLVSTTSFNSTPIGREQLHIRNQSQKHQDSALIKKLNYSDIASTKERLWDQSKSSFFEQSQPVQGNERKNMKSTKRVNMLDLLDKQNLDDFWRPTILKETKRAQRLQSNNLDFNQTYQKLRQTQKGYQNNFKPIFSKQKVTKTPGIVYDELKLKKIEKTLADSQGNEYRVTIQKFER